MSKALNLANVNDLKQAGLGGLAIVGTFIVSQAAKNFLMGDRTKADGTVAKALIPDKWYTNLIAAGLGIVGFVAATQLVSNPQTKFLLQLSSMALAGYFLMRTITKAGETLNGLGATGSVKSFIEKYVPNLGDVYATPTPGIYLGAPEDLPPIEEIMGMGAMRLPVPAALPAPEPAATAMPAAITASPKPRNAMFA